MHKLSVKKYDDSLLITTKQACELTNLGATTVRQIAEKSGARRKVGRALRIHKKTFLEYIENQYSEG